MKESWNMVITYSGKMYPCVEIFLLCNSVSFSKARRNRVSFFYLRKMKTSPGQAFISDSFRLLYKSSFFPISRIDHFPFGILLPYILQRYIKCDLNDHGFRHSQVFLSIKYVIQEVLQLDLIILNKWNTSSWVKKIIEKILSIDIRDWHADMERSADSKGKPQWVQYFAVNFQYNTAKRGEVRVNIYILNIFDLIGNWKNVLQVRFN